MLDRVDAMKLTDAGRWNWQMLALPASKTPHTKNNLDQQKANSVRKFKSVTLYAIKWR